MDVPRAEALACLHEHRIARVVGHLLGRPAARRRDPVRHEEAVCLELVRHADGRLLVGEEDERGRECRALAREHGEVEVVQRDDELDVVLLPKVGERRDVGRVGDPRTITRRSQ
jgi:hypothetical protein